MVNATMSSTTDGTTTKYVFYHYNPSMVAAIIFAALFGVLSLFHLIQVLRHRAWYFSVFVIGGVFEIVGYIGRVIASTQTPDWTLVPFIVQTLGILLAPNLFAASIYMTMGRLIRALKSESLSLVPTKRLTKIFVTGDVVSFLLQAAGGGMQAGKKQTNVKLGQYVVICGLAVQVIFFGIFVLVAASFHRRFTKRSPQPQKNSRLWPTQIYVLYISSLLIFIRSIVRIIEYVQGSSGYITSHEIFLYTLDAVPMLGVMIIYAIFHPHVVAEELKHSVNKNTALDEPRPFKLGSEQDHQKAYLLNDQSQC